MVLRRRVSAERPCCWAVWTMWKSCSPNVEALSEAPSASSEEGIRPLLRALRMSFSAYSKAGKWRGIPSSAEARSLGPPCFSAFLSCSHCAQTSSMVLALLWPKTWGWRWMSLSTSLRQTWSKSKALRSCPSWQWKTTCRSKSPSSSIISSSLPASMASISS